MHFPNENFPPRHSSSGNDCIIAPLSAVAMLSSCSHHLLPLNTCSLSRGKGCARKMLLKKGHVQRVRAMQSALRLPRDVPTPAGCWLAQKPTPLIKSSLGPWGGLALTFVPCSSPLLPTGQGCKRGHAKRWPRQTSMRKSPPWHSPAAV